VDSMQIPASVNDFSSAPLDLGSALKMRLFQSTMGKPALTVLPR
jgi:hypothetical protein